MGCQALGVIPGTLIDWAAGVIGIPCAVVRAQLNEESGGQAGLTSSAGARGPWQFEPGTWASLGCSGSFDDPNASTKCYATYMYQLVKQFHGNVRDALAAYNAGPGNLAAGYGYADTILAAAGQGGQLQAGTGSAAAAATASTGGASIGGTTDPACAFGLHTGIPGLSSLPGIGGLFQVDICLMHKTTIRHFVGGLLMLAGGAVALPGVIILAAFSFRASGAQRGTQQATQVLSRTPGYGQAIRYAQNTGQRRARSTTNSP